MRVALADGVGLNVEELGEGAPLIVLHGGPGLDHSMFRPYLDPLAEDVRLIYMDERGQGRSDRVDPQTLSLEVFAQDVDRLADTLGLERFALLGHSFGAIVATFHAIELGDGRTLCRLRRGRLERHARSRRRGSARGPGR